MLRVNNKTISFAKGENIAFSVEVNDADGQPFIFPALDTDIEYDKFLVFTVTNEYNEKVIEKYMDVSGPIGYLNSDGEFIADNSKNGYAKFSAQNVITVSNVNDFYGYIKTTSGNGTVGNDEQRANRLKIAKYENNYYCWCSNTEDAQSDDGQPVIYKFSFILNLIPSDTINLRVREYKYDLTAYIRTSIETVWKRQLIVPSALILEDSNNDY